MAIVNTNKVKSLMVARGLTQDEVAKQMNLNYSTLNLKINNERRIYIDEVTKLCEILNINTPALLKECFGLDFLYVADSRVNATNETNGGA